MTEFTPISALIGGSIIGLAASILFLLNGKIAGISGIVSSTLLTFSKNNYWRLLFLAGLISGCFVSYSLLDFQPPQPPQFSNLVLIFSGLAVGLGTVLGSGCTSGHGICGVSRLSVRSIVATLIFLVVGILTATLMGMLTQ